MARHWTGRASVHRARRSGIIIATAGSLGLLIGLTGVSGAYVVAFGTGIGVGKLHEPLVRALPGTAFGAYPGGPPLQVPVSIRNSAGAPFRVSHISVDPSGFPNGCPSAVWDMEPPSVTPEIPAKQTITIQVSASLKADAPDTCQGAVFEIPITVEGTLP